jgi:hypothetical protein
MSTATEFVWENRRAAVQIPSINPIEQLCGLTMDRPKRLNDRRDRQVHVDYLPQSCDVRGALMFRRQRHSC